MVLKQHKIGAVLSVCPVKHDLLQTMHLVIPVQDVDDQDLS